MVIAVYNPVGEVAPSEAVRTTTMTELHGKSVGFVCNHHPAITELWAQLEKSIERDFVPATVRRVAKANISMPQPAAQLAKLASEVDYALVGVGAWGSCTAAAVRDGCSLVKLGKPVVVIVQATFETAARVHAKGLGCPDLAICAYPHPSPGAPAGPDVMAALAVQIRNRVVELLSGRD